MAKLILLLGLSMCVTLFAGAWPYLEWRRRHGRDTDELPRFSESDIVAEDYARSNLIDTKVSTGTQGDFYAYAIGHKSTSDLGRSTDRSDVKSWDTRQLSSGLQFFGLYEANDESVANKLRASLLTDIANSVQDYLHVIDREASYPYPHPQKLGFLKDEIVQNITQSFVELDKSIGSAAGGSVSAAVFAVSKKYLVAANLGQGRIVAYDELGNSQVLSAPAISANGAQVVFGSGPLVVNVFERGFEVFMDCDKNNFDLTKYQFAIVQGPSVAQQLSAEEAVEIARGQTSLGQEQGCSAAVRGLVEEAAKRAGAEQKDFSAIVVDLKVDY